MQAASRVTLWCGVVAIMAAALPLHAQLPADARWHERESTHFRITYEADLDALAVHAIEVAERARAALVHLVADPPPGRIDIVLADNVDLSNGFATPFPSNRIVIYAKPPVDVLELQYTRDWIELVVTHELAHILHLDVTSRPGRVLRSVFGRVPASWPVFPAVGTPAWSIEGLAVGIESAVTEFGRVHGSYHEMVVRTAALEGTLDEYDRLGSSSARWPGNARVYIYGSLFMDYLARRFGPDAAARIVSASAGAIVPPPLWFDRVGSNALGIGFRAAYEDWIREVKIQADSIRDQVTATGVTQGRALTEHKGIALHPRFSRDGSAIAYAAHDWRTPPTLRAIAAADGTTLWQKRTNSPSALSWFSDATVITGDVDFADRFRIHSDLELIGARNERLTASARLQEPDVAATGRIVAVQNQGGTNRLVMFDPVSGELRALTDYDPDVHWALPRFAPDASRIAAGRWSRGGSFDIVVIDTAGGAPVSVTRERGISNAPAWSPDGRWLLFHSDRTGIPNIYAARLDDVAGTLSRLRQVTNVVTGAYFPDVAPDGSAIAYSAYGSDGFRIEVMPFDTTAWREPAAPLMEHGHATDDVPVLERMRESFASATVEAGPPGRYRPLRSLRPYFWLPVGGEAEDGRFYLGVWTSGQDLVQRHRWDATAMAAPATGRTRGQLSYSFHGLREVLELQPSLSLSLSRDWETVLPRTAPGELYIDEREDVASVSLNTLRQRWRSAAGFGIAAERIRKARRLHDAPELALLDPDDDLAGARVNAFYSRLVQPPLAISRESGFTIQATARERRDLNIRSVEREDGSVAVFDGSYRELTTWNAAYITLPFPGFARHVLGLRISALARTGGGAGFSSIGGVSSTGMTVPVAGTNLGGSTLLLPLRGYPRGVRAGTHAWTATAEYRFPIAHIDAPLRPFFFDRVSGSLFTDAGHAWCGLDTALRLPATACPSRSATNPPLTSAGAEATFLLGFLGAAVPLRAGVGVPITGTQEHRPRAYIVAGPSF